MEENLGKTSPIGVSGEFDHTAMIHVVMPQWQYDEMYTIWQEYKSQFKKKSLGEGFEDTNWYKLHVNDGGKK